MKVLVASAGIVSGRRPHGEALIAHHILSRLGRRGHDVVAYCTEFDDPIDGVTLKRISAHAPGAALSRLAFARRAARAARSERPDVIHLLLPLTTDAGYTTIGGAPLVVGPLMLPWPNADGGAPPRNRAVSASVRAVLSRVERRLHDKTLRRAAVLLTTGKPACKALDASLRDRCAEVPYGVDTARFAPSPLPDDPTILFFSVLLPRKGLGTLLDALPIVRERIPAVRLVVAGSDPRGLGATYRAQAERLGVDGVIEWAGEVGPAGAPALYARAKVFCQPSHGEPFGMTILEAMSSARPVVATAAGGVPGFVRHGENGLLVPPGDAELTADALTQMLTRSGEAQRIGERNRRVAVERFDWDRVVDGIEASYERAAGSATKEHRDRVAG